jgi:dCTP deaminase
LDRGQVYVIPLQESLHLPAAVRGLANPKSSTGRLDVLVRLIAENGVEFDRVDEGYTGPLYLEVAPQTFSVVVRPGTSLNQIRFIRGSKGAALTNGVLRRLYEANELVRPHTEKLAAHDSLVPVTIDLNGDGVNPIGYRAKEYTARIDLSKKHHYDWQDYWDPIYPRKSTLTLIPGEFYILATREEVRVPDTLAAEMVAYESRSGEYRVHYAGFFDPGFGCDPSGKGSKAVLEVRSYVPFMLEDGQPVGWLRYEKMADKPSKLYGGAGVGSSYQSQGLVLSKQFKPFSSS